jgi:hypothetical protein
MATILKPDDVLKRGDVLVQKYLRTDIGDEWIGGEVEYFIKHLPAPELARFVERPDPIMSDAETIPSHEAIWPICGLPRTPLSDVERVKILREALDSIENIHFGAYKDANTGEEAAYMRKLAHAALEATK